MKTHNWLRKPVALIKILVSQTKEKNIWITLSKLSFYIKNLIELITLKGNILLCNFMTFWNQKATIHYLKHVKGSTNFY